MKTGSLDDKEWACLGALSQHSTPQEFYSHFGPLLRDGFLRDKLIGRKQLSFTLKKLRSGGFVEFRRGLKTVDGELAGSGYCITYKGLEALGL